MVEVELEDVGKVFNIIVFDQLAGPCQATSKDLPQICSTN